MNNFQLIITCFLLIHYNNGFGQEWAPLGATWYYDQIEFSGDSDRSFIKYSVIGDTIIEGNSVKVFEQAFTTYLSYYDSILITKDTCYFSRIGDIVYFYDKNYGTFELTYDYSAQSGDTLIVWCNQGEVDIEVLVDSVSSININGFALRKFYVTSSFPQDCYMSGEIIENIGWTGFMFPQHSIADPPVGGPLRCYSDAIIGEFKISDKDCDFIVPSVESALLGINIYPNPFNRIIWFEDKNDRIERISIIDINGRIVSERTLVSQRIDLGDLSEGVYAIRIITNDGIVGYKKLIKNGY